MRNETKKHRHVTPTDEQSYAYTRPTTPTRVKHQKRTTEKSIFNHLRVSLKVATAIGRSGRDTEPGAARSTDAARLATSPQQNEACFTAGCTTGATWYQLAAQLTAELRLGRPHKMNVLPGVRHSGDRILQSYSSILRDLIFVRANEKEIQVK